MSRPEDRIHRVVARDIFRHRLVQPIDHVEPEDPGLARIVGAGTAGDDKPVVGDIRALRAGSAVPEVFGPSGRRRLRPITADKVGRNLDKMDFYSGRKER